MIALLLGCGSDRSYCSRHALLYILHSIHRKKHPILHLTPSSGNHGHTNATYSLNAHLLDMVPLICQMHFMHIICYLVHLVQLLQLKHLQQNMLDHTRVCYTVNINTFKIIPMICISLLI